MSLAQKCTSHHFHLPSPFNPKKIHPDPKPFDETLILRLKSLSASLPKSSPSVPLSFLIRAVDLLSSTLAAASALLSDPSLSRPEPDCFSSVHLDASVALLDSLNLVSSRIDRLSLLRLHVTYALHLSSSSRASAALDEWTANLRVRQSPRFSAADLIRSEIPPRGKIPAVRRAIYAVEAVSALVVGTLLSFLGAEADLDGIRVPRELAWCEAFEGVLAAVKRRAEGDGGFAAEIEALDSSVRSLTEETERRVEEVTEGLDRLGNAVNDLFRTALAARDAVLEGYRVRPRKCK